MSLGNYTMRSQKKKKTPTPKLMDTSCKEHTKLSCIIFIYIKNVELFNHISFLTSFFFSPQKKKLRSTNQRKHRKLVSVMWTKYFAKITSIEGSIPLNAS